MRQMKSQKSIQAFLVPQHSKSTNAISSRPSAHPQFNASSSSQAKQSSALLDAYASTRPSVAYQQQPQQSELQDAYTSRQPVRARSPSQSSSLKRLNSNSLFDFQSPFKKQPIGDVDLTTDSSSSNSSVMEMEVFEIPASSAPIPKFLRKAATNENRHPSNDTTAFNSARSSDQRAFGNLLQNVSRAFLFRTLSFSFQF